MDISNKTTLTLLAIFSLTTLILFLWLWLFFRLRRKKYPFVPRYLLTDSEYAFFTVLQECVPEGYFLFSKVRLWDVIDVDDVDHRQSFSNKIRAKHLDFLLTAEDTFPVLAIELDDPSHRRPDRVERDIFVDNALASAGIGILHIPTQKHYSHQKLSAQLHLALNRTSISAK